MIKSIKPIVLQIAILLLAILLLFIFRMNYAPWFADIVFHYLQLRRCMVFNFFFFSIGDVLYCVFSLYLLRKIYIFSRTVSQYQKGDWLISILKIIRFFCAIYFLVFVVWGIQYAQPKLSEKLELNTDEPISDEAIIAFDSVLIQRLNNSVKFYQAIPFQKLNNTIRQAYQINKQSNLVNAKYSLFGKGIGYMGATGYFNPVTGEAQVIKGFPEFMMPFLLAHEMAHQTGVAVEDDANLLAYISCVESKDSNLYYSACFNLWLYTHRKIRRIDSNLANQLLQNLNSISSKHLDTLKEWHRQNNTFLDDFTSVFFDAYLRASNQKDGIESYRGVVFSAYLWEQKKRMEQ